MPNTLFKGGKVKAIIQCLYCSREFYGYGFIYDFALQWALSYRAKHFYSFHYEDYKARFKNVINEKAFCNSFVSECYSSELHEMRLF